MKTLMEDKRKIERIEIFTQHSCDIVSYSHRDGFTEIKPYEEHGEMAPVVWFAIIKNEQVVARVNSKYVQVVEYI